MSAKYLKTAGTGGLTVRTSNNTDAVKVWDTGLPQFSKPVRIDDAVTMHKSVEILQPSSDDTTGFIQARTVKTTCLEPPYDTLLYLQGRLS